MKKLLSTIPFFLLALSGFSQKIIIEHSDKTPKPSMLEEGRFKVFFYNDTNSPIYLFSSHHKEYGGNETVSEKWIDGEMFESYNKWKGMDTNSRYDSRTITSVAPGKKKHMATMSIDEKKPGNYVLKYRIKQDPTTVDKRYASNPSVAASAGRITKFEAEGTFEYVLEQLEKKPFKAREITYEELKKEKYHTGFAEAEYDPSSIFSIKLSLEDAADAAEKLTKLSALKNVRKLQFSVNSNEDIVVPAAIGDLPLMELGIFLTKKYKGKLILPNGFLKSGSLRVVNLTRLKDTDISFLGNHPKMEKLTLHFCDLSEATWLGNMTGLTELNLTENHLTELPAGFEKLTQLKKLHLKNNRLTSIENLPAASELIFLSLGDNALTALPASILKLQNLSSLDCPKNKIKEVPADMSALVKITNVNLRENEMTVLPVGLLTLPNVKELNLSYNQLSSLPDNLSDLTALNTLYLSKNEFKKFPKGILKVSKLSVLNIKDNQISTLPVGLTKLRMSRFNFENNKITELPEGFTDMKPHWLYTKGNLLDKKTDKKIRKAFGKRVKS